MLRSHGDGCGRRGAVNACQIPELAPEGRPQPSAKNRQSELAQGRDFEGKTWQRDSGHLLQLPGPIVAEGQLGVSRHFFRVGVGSCWQCTQVGPLGKVPFLTSHILPYVLATLLGVHPRELSPGVCRQTQTGMLTSVQFTLAKKWKRPTCPRTMNKQTVGWPSSGTTHISVHSRNKY